MVMLFDARLPDAGLKKLTSELQPDVLIPFHASEENKSLSSVQQMVSAAALSGADRQFVWVNAGGGTLCDTGAFAASVFKRGIDFINIPTTLLAQCDAAIGGKTALNLSGIKNVIGTYHFPVAVLIEPYFLKSLDQRVLNSGLAEIIKTAIIANRSLFRLLSGFSGLPAEYAHYAWKSAKTKLKIIQDDPFDRGLRQSLNFGHTVGHALESLFMDNDSHLLHGEAVAFGMVAETFIALQKKLISIKELNRITDLIQQQFHLPAVPEATFESMIHFMSFDKKNRSGKIIFSLPEGIGSCRIGQPASKDQIISAMQFANFVFQHHQ
jgi:3-dehydroquinate synthase